LEEVVFFVFFVFRARLHRQTHGALLQKQAGAFARVRSNERTALPHTRTPTTPLVHGSAA
jgi:hypothetical protein